MKYIRTKDNIYEIVNDYGNSCAVKSRGKRGRIAIDGFTIKYGLSYAPRADTIEELCDEFVWENRLLGKGNVDFKSKTTYVSKGGCIPFSDWEYAICGAIWTDKGLIYVAKMNLNGELELL